MFHDLLGVFFIVEPVVPALHAAGCGVGDVLPAVCPSDLAALALHQRNKFIFGFGVPHALVDGVHQPELPTLPLGGGAVLPAAHPFLSDLLFRLRKGLQAVCGTDLVAGQSVGPEVGGALVEFFSVPEADAVHDEVTVQMVCIDVSSDQHLEIGELPLGQFQSDGVGLLGRQVIRLCEGLDEVVVLPPVRFSKPLLCELHL